MVYDDIDYQSAEDDILFSMVLKHYVTEQYRVYLFIRIRTRGHEEN